MKKIALRITYVILMFLFGVNCLRLYFFHVKAWVLTLSVVSSILLSLVVVIFCEDPAEPKS